MEASLIFLYIIFFLSIVILVVAGTIYAMFVIPLQYKEAKVKNGLATLRKQMLAKGVLALIVIIVAIFCLTGRFIVPDMNLLRYIITSAILVFSLGILGKGIIDYQIYHQQFSDESKKLHEMFEEHEVKKDFEAKLEGKVDKKKKK